MAAIAAVAAGTAVGIFLRHLGIPVRWQWWTDSPNGLGALLAADLPLLLGLLAVHGWDDRGRMRRLVAVPAIAAVLVAVAGLVGTCSRGGLLAAMAGLGLLAAAGAPGMRRIAVAAALALALAVALVPRAGARVATAPAADRSIACRIDLIDAAAMMLADRPGGWGADRFASDGERWYLARFWGANLWHPLHDALWIGTTWGIAAMACFLGGSLALLAGLLAGARGFPAHLPVAAALLALLVAGNTTGLLRPGGIRTGFAAIVALAACAVWRSRSQGRRLAAWTCAGCAAGLGLTLAWWGWGRHLAASWPYRPLPQAAVAMAEPRLAASRATVVVVAAESDRDNDVSRQVLRPLVAEGFTACAVPARARAAAVPAVGACLVLLLRDVPDGALPPHRIRGLVCLASDGRILDRVRPGCPVLLLHGRDEPPVPPERLAACRDRGVDAVEVAVPAAYSWPRNFHRCLPAIAAWQAAASVRGAATPEERP